MPDTTMKPTGILRFFGSVAGAFGLLYALLLPPFQSPDETAHFYRTVHLASGHLMGEKTAGMRLGGYLPKNIQQVYQSFSGLRYDYSAKVGKSAFEMAWRLPLNGTDTTFVDFPNVGYYAPFPYLLQGLVAKVFIVFNCRPLLLLYVGRLSTLALWLVLVLAALRMMPFHNWTLAWLALLPSSLFLHSSLTGDALTNGLCFWLLAALLSMIFEKHGSNGLSSRRTIGIFLCSAIITLSKPVYLPIVLLAWLIPKDRFNRRTGYLSLAGGLLIFNLALLAWWYSYAGDRFIPYDNYHPMYRDRVQLNEGVQPHEQLAHVWDNPFGFTKTVLLSYIESAPATLAHYFGKFGWEKNYLPTWLIALLFFASFWVAMANEQARQLLQTRHRLYFLAIAFSMMFALALVLYMQWMPVGSDRILALNGRYFFPVFPLCFMALSGLPTPLDNHKWWLFAKALLLISLLWGVWEVAKRYYF
jgi:uncharacterized membrane protein